MEEVIQEYEEEKNEETKTEESECAALPHPTRIFNLNVSSKK